LPSFDLVPALKLRDYLLMSSNGVPSWPPEWIWADGLRNAFRHPTGEIGILEDVAQSMINPDRCFFIRMRYNGSLYLGRVKIDDKELCKRIFELLKTKYARSIEEIGAMEIST
jgi:hypothetical protein